MENQPILPQPYLQPVPLNRERHAATTVAASPKGFAFAAEMHSVVLAGAEFAEACRCFPILFAADGENGSDAGAVLPVALLGLQAEQNLCVGSAGQWQAAYVPAYIRRYPFIHADGAEGETVFIDEAYDGLNQEGGEALFRNGEPSDYLQKVLRFMTEFQAQIQGTVAFCKELRKLELLKPVNASVGLPDGRRFTLADFLVVDEQKLLAIGSDELERLFRSGEMALVYAHLLSLRSMQWLVDRKAGR